MDYPMGANPSIIICPNCSNEAKIDFIGQALSSSTIIPYHMQATNKYGINDTRKLYKKDAAIEKAASEGI